MTFKEQVDTSSLEQFCRRWHIREFAMFGSAVRGTMTPDSDVDVPVTFAHGEEPALIEFSRLIRELEQMLGRPVDVLTHRGVEESRNPHRRREILDTAETLYAA